MPKTIAGTLMVVIAVALVSAQVPTVPNAVPIWQNGGPDTAALLPYLPSAAKNTGAAVLLIPGGDRGGSAIATWLSEQGIAAFVLRYRSVADVTRATQYVRSHAAEFKVAPARIGMMGFGSGAELGADAVYNHAVAGDAAATDIVARQSSRPNFMALVYGSAPAEKWPHQRVRIGSSSGFHPPSTNTGSRYCAIVSASRTGSSCFDAA